VRPARPDDAAELVRLRAEMFAAMGHSEDAPGWRAVAEARLQAGLAADTFIGFVVDAPEGGGLAACVVAELLDRLPTPGDAACLQAYVSNVSTDPRWRRRGHARAVVAAVVLEAARRGATRIELHATGEGRPLYESLGFGPRPGEPELRWDPPA
jgi:GNAT superfamily N-acetyltransferase